MNPNARASSAAVSGPALDNRRVLAALIDLAIVGVAGVAILAAADALGGSPSEIGLPLIAVVLGWALYYYFACESGSGQTVGKRAMRIRVVRTDGAPADMREIGVRTVLRLIDMQLVYLVGLAVMLATGQRRGRLGDLVGDTMIVSADEPAAVAPVVTEVAAVAPAAERSRVPIAESGPAFEEPVVEEPVVEEPLVEAEPIEEQPAEDAPDIASPAVVELAADVAAAASEPDSDQDVEQEEVDEPVEAEAVEQDVEAEVEVLVEEDEAPEQEPVADADEPDEEPDEEIRVKSVETVSPIDLVMEADEDDQDAVAGERTRATRG